MRSLAPRLRAREMAERYFAHPIARVLIVLKVSPDLLTLAGFGVAVVAAWLLAEGALLDRRAS